VLWDAVGEFLKGSEILSRVFEAIDEVEVGLAAFLVRNIAVMPDLDTPNVNGCAESEGVRYVRLRHAKVLFICPLFLLSFFYEIWPFPT